MPVVGFRNSDNLAAAYGIAVTDTFAMNTVLVFVVPPNPFVELGAQVEI